jgi:putative DNA methylase
VAVIGAHKDGMKYRPASTTKYPLDNHGNWTVFWEVTNLMRMSSGVKISLLRGFEKPHSYLVNFIPRGAIPLEATRLGLSTIANDLNPVAATILEATIDWPRRLGRPLLNEFERIGAEFRSRIKPRISAFFSSEAELTTKSDGYLWARTITCPYCTGLVPLSPNWKLDGTGKGVGLRPHLSNGPNSAGRVCNFEIVDETSQQSPATISGGDANCPFSDCGRVIDGDEVKRQAQAGQMGDQLYTVVAKRKVETRTKSGKVGKPKWERYFRAPLRGSDDATAAEKALKEKEAKWQALDLLPTETIPEGNKTEEPLRYGMKSWKDVFLLDLLGLPENTKDSRGAKRSGRNSEATTISR